MQSSSRRAFLTGRRPPRGPWQAFCRRLARVVKGHVDDLDPYEGFGRARLIAEQAADVHHARALCRESGVILAIEGLDSGAEQNARHVLWVEAGRGLSSFQPLEAGSDSWFVQPGVMVGELEAVGFQQFSSLPAHLTVAEWLADRTNWCFPGGHMADSGLVFASLLLDDGTVAGLGPFGQNNTRPLQGARLQQLVPALFQLAMSDDARWCLQHQPWPASFRLDTLCPADGRTINLANLVAGHGGALGWVEWVVLAPPVSAAPAGLRTTGAGTVSNAAPARRLDNQVKHLFDPAGVFMALKSD